MGEKKVTESINEVFKLKGGFRKIHFRLKNDTEIICNKFKFSFEFKNEKIIINDFTEIKIENIAAIY